MPCRELRFVLSVVFYVVNENPQNRIRSKSCRNQKKTPEIRRFQVLFCRVLTEKMRSGKFQASIASYIESYNTQMPHRTLKNLTPCQVEENSIEKAE